MPTEQNGGLGPNASRIKQVCPALLDLLLAANGGRDLLQVLDYTANADGGATGSSSSPPDNSDSDSSSIPFYWQQVHLMLLFRVLVSRTARELADAVMLSHKGDAREIEELPYANVTPSQLSDRLQLFQSLLAKMDDDLKAAEQSSEQEAAQCLAQVAQAYKLKAVEQRVLQFLVTTKIQPCPCALFLVLPAPYGYDGSLQLPGSGGGGDESMAYTSSTIRYVCGATSLHWSALASDDHALCKDRVLIWEQEEYSDTSKLRVPTEVCKAFMTNLKLTSEEKLKLSGTKLLHLLVKDVATAAAAAAVVTKTHKKPPERSNSTDGGDVEDTVDDILSKLQLQDSAASLPLEEDNDNDANDDDDDILAELLVVDKDGGVKEDETKPEQAEEAAEDGQSDSVDNNNNIEEDDEDRTKPRAYESELDYLHQFFEIVMHKIIFARQRVAQDLRNASLTDNKPSWRRNAADTSSKQRSVGEISAKLRLAGRKKELSLELTRQQGVFFPRLELLAEQLVLDDFQKFVLVYLAGSMISPIFKSCIQGEDSYHQKNTKVGDLLVAYFDTFAEQVGGRTYFYKSSKLLRKGLIKAVHDYKPPTDLTDQELRLDRRVLDCIVGLDKESSEISHGSHLYEPKISLDTVVLPEKLKETITGSVAHFEQFRTYRKHHPDFDEAIAYGVGLTLMFCGKSGTGKTMTANAIAAKLGKKLLLVNFPLLNKHGERDDSHEASKYQSIFREAELSEAIIFFDECESLFSKRSDGGSADTTELLTELERFEGIVFLATNRPFDLDEAMYRRISEVFEFKQPNYLERLDIWKLVTSHKAVPCDPTIDWESIALQYELTGGFIKNAVISSLLDAVGRNSHSPQINQKDIVNGCKKQVRGALQMLNFNERVIPRGGLNELVVSESVLGKLNEMVSLEKARGILFGSWGFDDDMRARQGTTALFWGKSGTGRSRSAEAVGFELGKPLKVVDLPRLLSDTKGQRDSNGDGGAEAARSVFKEARLMDAVLVLDGFSLETEQNGGGGTGADARLLNIVVREMARFPGVVIMMVDTSGSLDVFVSRIDKSLVKNLKFLVEYQLPSIHNRRILWEKLMPPALPVLQDIDYKKLAEATNEFSVSHIGNAIYRAAAAAALRTSLNERFVGMKDLYAAIEDEKKRGESAVDRWVKSQYI